MPNPRSARAAPSAVTLDARETARAPKDHAHLEHERPAVAIRGDAGNRGTEKHSGETHARQQPGLRCGQSEFRPDRAEHEGEGA